MQYTTLPDNSRVAYHTSGATEGTPLILLHGFCEDTSVWTNWLQYFEPEYIVCIDLPGFGGSDVPKVAAMETYTTAIASVLDTLGASQCVLIGHSLGGYAALAFARTYPERLVGLGLFHSHPYPDPEERKEARRRGIETLQAGKKDLYVAQLFPGLFAPAFAQANPDIIQKLVENGKKQPVEGIIAALKIMMDRMDCQEVLRDLAVPVQFLLGAEDTLVPIAMGLQSSILPAIADVQILDSVGHMAMFEAPQPAAIAVRAFYKWATTV